MTSGLVTWIFGSELEDKLTMSTAMLRASFSTAGEKHNPRNSRENVSQIGYPVLLSHLKVVDYFSA